MSRLILGVLCSALLLTACSGDKDDWRAAQAADTSLAYSHFVSQHPDSSHVAEARSRASALVVTETAAMSVGDTPASAVVSPAPANDALPVADVPPVAAAAPEVAASPVVAAPTPVVAPAAVPVQPAPQAAAPPKQAAVPGKPSAAKASGYGAQIGAFSSRAKAQSQWQTIEKRYSRELAGSTHQIAEGKAGSKAVFRLKVPQPSQAAAKALCSRLAAGGQSCVVYHP